MVTLVSLKKKLRFWKLFFLAKSYIFVLVCKPSFTDVMVTADSKTVLICTMCSNLQMV